MFHLLLEHVEEKIRAIAFRMIPYILQSCLKSGTNLLPAEAER